MLRIQAGARFNSPSAWRLKMAVMPYGGALLNQAIRQKFDYSM